MDDVSAARKWIVMPVETKARELDAKALFAFAAAERGWGTILGTTSQSRVPSLPRGVFLGHAISHGFSRVYRDVVARGSRVVAWCEEGLVYRDAHDYGRRKVEKEAYDLLEMFFAWGPNQARDMVDGLGCSGSKLVVSGNPRFDVLRPEHRGMLTGRAAGLRRRHGRFLLVNTNLNKYNHYFGPEYYVRRARGTMAGGAGAAEEWARGAVAFQGAMMRALVAAVHTLARTFPDHAIVIRPHPSEDHARWRSETADIPQATVVFDGNVAAWILAADATIHNNCTTGVEAHLLGRPAIAFRPVCDERFDLRLPHSLSAEAADEDTLCALVRRRLAGESLLDGHAEARAAVALEYIAGIDGAPAFDTILDAFERLDVAPEAMPADALAGLTDAEPLPDIPRAWDDARARRYRGYVRQKCNALTSTEVSTLLAAARRVTGRFACARVADLGRDLVCVY